MAWTNLTFSFGAILTSAQMTQLDANFDALAAADSGAPQIVDAALVWPGAWAKIDSWVPTATTSKDFVWDETLYSDILIMGEGLIPATDGAAFYGYLGYGNGGTFFSGTSRYVAPHR